MKINNSQKYWRANLGIVFLLLLFWFLSSFGAGILFRTELIKKVGNYNINFREAEDHELILRLNKICKGYYLPLPLYRYYIHENNISKSGNRKKYINLIKKNEKKI